MGGGRGPGSRGTLPSTCCQASPDAALASTAGGSGCGPPGLGLGLLWSPVEGPGASGHVCVLWMDVLSCPGAAGAGAAASVGEAGRRTGVRGAGAREGDTAQMRPPPHPPAPATRWVQEAPEVEAPERRRGLCQRRHSRQQVLDWSTPRVSPRCPHENVSSHRDSRAWTPTVHFGRPLGLSPIPSSCGSPCSVAHSGPEGTGSPRLRWVQSHVLGKLSTARCQIRSPETLTGWAAFLPPSAAPIPHPARHRPPHSHLVPAQPPTQLPKGTFRPSRLLASCPQPPIQFLLHQTVSPLWLFWDAHRSISRKGPSVELPPVLQSLPPGDLLFSWGPQAEEATGQAYVCLRSVALGRPSCASPLQGGRQDPDPSCPHGCPYKGPRLTGHRMTCLAPSRLGATTMDTAATLCAPLTAPEPMCEQAGKANNHASTQDL